MAAREGHVGSKGCPDCVHGVSFGLAHPFFFQRDLEMTMKTRAAGWGERRHTSVATSPRGLGIWGSWSSRELLSQLPGWQLGEDTS